MALNCAIHCAATLFGFYQVYAKKLKPDIWAISRVFRERGISLPLGWTQNYSWLQSRYSIPGTDSIKAPSFTSFVFPSLFLILALHPLL